MTLLNIKANGSDFSTMQNCNDFDLTASPTIISNTNSIEQLLSDKDLTTSKTILLHINYVILPFALLVTVVNIVVFLHKSMRSSTGYYVVGLSLAQVGYLAIDVGFHILVAVISDPDKTYSYFVYTMYVINFSLAVLRSWSYLVMCLVSVERLYAVWRPLHIKSFFLARFPTSCMISAFVCIAICHFYLYVRYEIKEIPDKVGGGARYILMETNFYLKNSDSIQAFSAGVKVVFSYLILGVLMTLNVMTLVFLRRHSVERRSLKTSSKSDAAQTRRECQMTRTILGATICYVIFSLPLAVHSLVSVLNPNYTVYSKQSPLTNLFLMLSRLSYQCILLSCFSDFFSFIILSSGYRRIFLRIFLFPARKIEKTVSLFKCHNPL